MGPEGACNYRLLIRMERPGRLPVGRLGRFAFPAGHYVYTGSARRNIRARLRRHLARGKTLRWHIDYLLAAPAAQVVDVAVFDEEECAVNAATPGRVPVPGFGAGDCRTGCGAHLKYLGPMCGEKSRTNAAHRLSPCGHPVASSQ